MFKNYLKIAIVSIRKNILSSGINIFGLALGLSLCLLIIIIVKEEFSYDNFHVNRDKIFRINTNVLRTNGDHERYATTTFALGSKLMDGPPFVESVVRLTNSLNGECVVGEKKFNINGFFTDPAFFELFGFEWLHGNKQMALYDPSSLVLTERYAEQLFGNTDPIGKLISIKGKGNFIISGVLRNPPGKTHLVFDALGSNLALQVLEKDGLIRNTTSDWKNIYSTYVYVRVSEKNYKNSLSDFISTFSKNQYSDIKLDSKDKNYSFYLQGLEEIVPGPLLSNNLGRALPIHMLRIFVIMAILVITSSVFNYSNLSLARSLSRAKEVGIRKVNGARRPQLIIQFLVEAVVTTMIALVLAYFLLHILLIPGFKSLNIFQEFELSLAGDWFLLVLFAVFTLIVGIVAGLSPALYLSKISPLKSLGNLSIQKNRVPLLGFRQFLLGIQFVLAILLGITVVNIYRQSVYLEKGDYGFDPVNIVNIKLNGNDYSKMSKAISEISELKNVSGISHLMGVPHDRKIEIRVGAGSTPVEVENYSVDQSYVENLQLKLIAGVNFSPDLPNNRELHAIVNEKFLDKFHLGRPSEALGKNIILSDSISISICGVLKDFHFKSFIQPIEPMILRYRPSDITLLNVQIGTANQSEAVRQIAEKWKSLDNSQAMSYTYFTDDLRSSYRNFSDMKKIFGIISFLALLLLCMGLLGLTMFSIRKNVKEIAIRKVLGATVGQVLYYVSRNYLRIFIFSALIAIPLSIIFNRKILEQFAYRVNPLVGYIFGATLLFALVIIIVSSTILKAATSNPSKNLRVE